MDGLLKRAKNTIFKFSLDHEAGKWEKHPFHLNYESGAYRQAELASIIRDAVIYFALTPQELADFSSREDISEAVRAAWSRISKANSNAKGDYGEVLLFIILSVFFPNVKRFVTKARLRSSTKDQIKGFDCAHFTVEGNDILLWLGEAKFHKSFSSAINQAVESIKDHVAVKYLKDELSILGQNIELNKKEPEFELINNVLNGSKSLDDIKIKIPVLLTYDHSSLKNYSDISSNDFIQSMGKEFLSKFQNIEKKELALNKNLEVIFFIFPLESVEQIKQELEKMETANR
ncbi:MAG: DUF1837 domain-containing protein [Candidatus Doudnabacteria bacterium]|nr:DUF1837 domain-containing protein [Candidatus Doudnabacteria bacterium]